MAETNLQALVEKLLAAYGIGTMPAAVRRVGNSSFRPTVIVRAPVNKRTAIEVRPGPVDSRYLYAVDGWYDEARARRSVDKLLLVTAEPPTAEDRQRFATILDGDDAVQWIGIVQLPALLGITDDIDLSSRHALVWLETATLERTMSNEDAEAARMKALMDETKKPAQAPARDRPPVGRGIARQMSSKSLGDVEGAGRPMEKALRIGEEIRPFVLLSDIKSFSTLVRVGDPAVIQEMMNAYYRRARQIVWANGGVLDKFIGDAVLAIWGYPESAPEDAANAVRGATELIALGRALVEEFLARHNEAIESGTRVGLSSDAVLVLNIGTDQVEVSFVGNGINLAARLEKASVMDGILMDNRTKAALSNTEPELELLTGAQEVVLDQEHAKGQLTSIRAWQILPAGVDRVLNARPPAATDSTTTRQAANGGPTAS